MSTILNREGGGGLAITEAWGVLNFWIFSTNFTLANVLRKVLIFWHSRARYSYKKNVYKRFLHLRNTLPTTIDKNPSPEDQPSFILSDQQSLYCPGLRPPRGGTSLEKFLTLLHPLDDHLTGHVACLNRTVRSHQQQQVNQGMATRSLINTKTDTRIL